jgi:hypothetical protein
MSVHHRLAFYACGLSILAIAAFSSIAYAADAVSTNETPAAAEDRATEALPLISIEGSAELQMDAAVGRKPRTTAIYATIEPEITVNLSDSLRLFGHLILEPVKDPIDDRTNAFRSQGLYAEELYAVLTVSQFEFQLGKIDPAFGIATDEAPGVYGSTLAEGYDFKAALGLAANVTLFENTAGTGDDAVTVKQMLQASVFTSDPTVLSRSLLTDRGLYHWQDNRVGNTSLPESFALAYTYSTLNAEDDVAGPTGRIALRRLAARDAGVPDEWDVLATARTSIDLGDERALRPLAEIAYLIHEGGRARNAVAGTAGLEFQQDDWIASATGAVHDRIGSGNPYDFMLTGSVGRVFNTQYTGEFRLDAAYSHERQDGQLLDVVGLRFHKDLAWQSSATSFE